MNLFSHLEVSVTGKQLKNGFQKLLSKKLILTMKLTGVLILVATLHVSAKTFSQQVTLSEKNAKLEKVFKSIKQQTGFVFFYDQSVLKQAKVVTINIKNVPLETALNMCFQDQPLTYSIVGSNIVVKEKPGQSHFEGGKGDVSPLTIDITGKVTDTDGNPLVGATVNVKGTTNGTTTNNEGVFVLKGVDENATLEISFVGYQPLTLAVNNRTSIITSLKLNVITSPEVIIRKGYYDEKRATSTGNVSTVTSKEIQRQPVANPLLALQGLIPGIAIGQQNGMPGTAVGVRIRGQNTIYSGNEPLYIVDGVPYPSNNFNSVNSVLGYASGGGNGSPFSYLNPSDIETIDVLKDADATAIYGSRGANGVILITTKAGKAGRARIDLNVQSGIGRVANKLKLLDTRQYLDMRYEALKNDGIPLSSLSQSGNYDLTVWDTTRYTDWQKELIGGTARYNDIQCSFSGGNNSTQFLVGSGYHSESSVFPGDLSDKKTSVHFNLTNTSVKNKLFLQLSGSYLIDDNNIISNDLTEEAVQLPPNAPAVFNSDKSLNWALDASGNTTWPGGSNPLAWLLRKFKSRTSNLTGNAVLKYNAGAGLELKTNFGYGDIQSSEIQILPLNATSPSLRPFRQRTSFFGDSKFNSWIIEPQITLRKKIFRGELNVLIGSSFLQQKSDRQQFNASGFISDLLMEDIKSATSVSVQSSISSVYKYNGFFGRLNYDLYNRYIVNVTGRRDGSSRFGPENQFHNFGAIGGAWVFSKEKFFEKKLRALSFGKLRISYGTTGSDQIGDYKFMDLFGSGNAGVPYQGTNMLAPVSLYSPDLAWEETKKSEIGLDIGLFNNRVNPTFSFYRTLSSNQLVNQTLSSVTGFTSIYKNIGAEIQNIGWEFELRTSNLNNKNLRWTTYFNLSLNRNKLLSGGPGLSPFILQKVGHSLFLNFLYKSSGVDPITGIYQFADVSGHVTSLPNPVYDRIFLLDPSTKYYGGFSNNFNCKGIELDILFTFAKQIGRAYLFNYVPGVFSTLNAGGNQPIYVLQRWQKPGDVTDVQRFSTNNSLANVYGYAIESNLSYRDASYVALKNMSISWLLPRGWHRSVGLEAARILIQGQNLFTISKYQGLNAVTQSSTTLPPLRVITLGAQLSF